MKDAPTTAPFVCPISTAEAKAACQLFRRLSDEDRRRISLFFPIAAASLIEGFVLDRRASRAMNQYIGLTAFGVMVSKEDDPPRIMKMRKGFGHPELSFHESEEVVALPYGEHFIVTKSTCHQSGHSAGGIRKMQIPTRYLEEV